MIVFDRFAFLHVPKTAGAFTRELITLAQAEKVLPVDSAKHQWHIGANALPKDLKIYSILRDPLDWYQSWARYWEWRRHDSFYLALSDNATLHGADLVARAVTPGPNVLRLIDDLMPEWRIDAAHIALHAGITREWARLDCGLYSLLLQRLFNRNWIATITTGTSPDYSNIHVLQQKSIRSEFIRMLKECEYDVTPHFEAQVHELNATNVSRYPKFELSPDLISTIQQRDALAFDWVQHGIH